MVDLTSIPDSRVLITIFGPDRPGITATLTSVLAQHEARLLDIEQVVVHGQVTLCLLIAPPATNPTSDFKAVLKDVLFETRSMGLDAQFKTLEPPSTATGPRRIRYAVTALADDLGAHGMHLLSKALATDDANIESIQRLSLDGLGSVEIIVSHARGAAQAANIRHDLLAVALEQNIDVAVQRERLARRSKRLIVLDMDSTLIQVEVIDELAALHGVGDRVRSITDAAMHGELDYEQSLHRRVALLEGLSVDRVQHLADHLPLTEGAEQMLSVLKQLGYVTAVISGGFDIAANALKEKMNLDYAFSNRLEVDQKRNVLTGRVTGDIVTPERKALLLEQIAHERGIPLDQTVAVGDGANDLLMLEKAGLGVAYRAKPKLKEAADTSVSSGGLDRILYLLGFRQRDVRELMEAEPDI